MTQATAGGDDFVQRVAEDIKRSGFPLEIEVINACMANSIPMMPNVRYEYQGELREIDVLAYCEYFQLDPKRNENLQYTSTEMIIECKKSESKPWVFFSCDMGHLKTIPQVGFVKYVSDFDLHFRGIGKRSLLGQIASQLRDNHYNDSAIPRCIGYCEAFRDDKSRGNNIYRAIDSVLSFLSWNIGVQQRQLHKLGCFSDFYFPVIVLDGELLEAKLDNKDLKVNRRNHIQLRTIYERGRVFIIDIVKKEWFQTYLQMIKNDHKGFAKSIGKLEFGPAHKKSMKRHRVDEMRALEKKFSHPFPEAG